jgi:LacI family transcriptional regulator
VRPTVIDIARVAGVSLATVDRVLNERPGVREKTIRAVNDAIRNLGYVRDVAAANLARQRSYLLAFVLPDTDSQFVQTLLAELAIAASVALAARTEITVIRFPAEDPHALASILADLPYQGVSGVALMAPETPILRDAIKAMRQAGLAVVALVSDLPNTLRDRFVGIDNRAAGRTSAVLMGRFLGQGPQKVAVVAQSMLLREAVERRLGFDDLMGWHFPLVQVLPTLESHGSPDLLRAILGELLSQSPDLGGIYLLGSDHLALTQAIDDLGKAGQLVVIGHELTAQARTALIDGKMDAVITQNVGHLVRSALRVLRAKADKSPIDAGQEQLRIEIVLRENLPPAPSA